MRFGFAGCPDIVAFILKHTVWIEVKNSEGGVLSKEQVKFRDMCYELEIPYIFATNISDVECYLAKQYLQRKV